MRKVIYAIVYLAALIIGAVLLIFNHQVVENTQPMLHPVIIAAGIIFVIPGLCLLIASLIPHKDSNGVVISRPWISTVMGIIALIWGVLILIMPGGLLGYFNITLGVSVILAGIAQITWIIKGRKTNGAPIWLYLIPLLTIAAGVWIIILKQDYQNPGRELIQGCIIAGVTLIVWAINGFGSLPRRKKTLKDIEKETRRLAEEQKKVVKDQAEEAKARLAEAEANTEAARRNEELAREVAEKANKKLEEVKEPSEEKVTEVSQKEGTDGPITKSEENNSEGMSAEDGSVKNTDAEKKVRSEGESSESAK
ncbi:MAG: DUF308 domain-containing protein [Muribaculaceae bacterium]|nr:DUF308 domain-containing protein [Muribaculaceae bacterium]